VIDGGTRRFKAMLHILQDKLKNMLQFHVLQARLTAFMNSKTGRFKAMLHILQSRLKATLQLHILKVRLTAFIDSTTGWFKIMLPLHLLQRGSIRVKLFMTIFLHQLQPDPKYCNKGNAIETAHLKAADINDEESRQMPQHRHNH
jgi:hypothetical protein